MIDNRASWRRQWRKRICYSGRKKQPRDSYSSSHFYTASGKENASFTVRRYSHTVNSVQSTSGISLAEKRAVVMEGISKL